MNAEDKKDYYLFLSGKPGYELYHWEKILFVSDQAAKDYLDNFEASTFGPDERQVGNGYQDKTNWFWGPTIIPISLSDNDTAWPTVWDGHQAIPVEVVR